MPRLQPRMPGLPMRRRGAAHGTACKGGDELFGPPKRPSLSWLMLLPTCNLSAAHDMRRYLGRVLLPQRAWAGQHGQ